MEQMGMLVVSLRGVNFGFLVLLRYSRQSRQYFKLPRCRLGFCEEIELRKEKSKKSNFLLN